MIRVPEKMKRNGRSDHAILPARRALQAADKSMLRHLFACISLHREI
jgi:hypothetical protein